MKIHHSKVILSLFFLAVALFSAVGSAEPASAGIFDPIFALMGLAETQSSLTDPQITIASDFGTGIIEGNVSSYNISLSEEPTGHVTVRITSDNAGVAVTPSVTFNTGNWNEPKSIAITPAHDQDNEDDSVTITHTASEGGYNGVTKSIDVNILDDEPDNPAIVLSGCGSGLTENGESCDYTVKLSEAPSGSGLVIVNINSDNPDVTLSKNIIRFNKGNYSAVQTITATAAHDIDGINDVARITHTAKGGGYHLAPVKFFDIVVTDDDDPDLNDPPRVIVSPKSSLINENSKISYKVNLSHRPTGDVTVQTSIDKSMDNGFAGDITLTPTQLTFTILNWNIPQTINLTAGSDGKIRSVRKAVINHTASGNVYDDSEPESLALSVRNIDVAQLKLSSASNIVEEGGSLVYNISLGAVPDENVVVNVATASSKVTVSPSALTLNSTNMTRNVTITGVQDNDYHDENAVIVHTTTSDQSDYSGLRKLFVVKVDDDELINPRIVFNVSALSLDENSAAKYSVKLSTVPTADVTVTLTSLDTAKITVGASSLTFTSSNWNDYQEVTVTSLDEETDGMDENVKISHSAAGGGFAGVKRNLTVTVIDPDPDAPEVKTSPKFLGVNEGADATYTVRLNEKPTRGDVTVTLATTNEKLTVEPASLTFTDSNWHIRQIVNVSAAEDDNSANEIINITHTAAGGGFNRISPNPKHMQVIVNDNEPTDQGILLSKSVVEMEEGTSTSYSVSLNDKPSDNVTVSLAYTKSLIRVSSAQLVFTPQNYRQAQTVQVDAKNDLDNRNEEELIIHSASGGGYDNIRASLRIAIDDDEPLNPSITVDPAAVTVNEGSSGSYGITLNEKPNADVTVTLNLSNEGITASPESLTFTPQNYDQAQTVTVTAKQDGDNVNNQTEISHVANSGGYSNVRRSITITVDDDEPGTPGIIIAPSEITILEGSASAYTVALNETPGSDVTVSLDYDSSVLEVSPASLTFTVEDWSRTKTVSVTAKHDQDNTGSKAVITHASSGGGYDGLQGILNITINDDDLIDPALVLGAEGIRIDENSSAVYTVKLKEAPKGDVTVSISTNRAAALSLNPSSLRFNSSNWDANQIVSLSALQDSDSVNDVAIITHIANGGGYNNIKAPDLTVNITDRISAPKANTTSPAAKPEILTSETSMDIDEGDDEVYEVRLSKQPTGSVTVRIRSSKSDVEVDPENLVFTVSNWNDYQEVEVSVRHDSDARDEDGVITHTAAGGGYDSALEKEVDVDIDDDDTEDDGSSSRTAQASAPAIQLPAFKSAQNTIVSKASGTWTSWKSGQSYTADLRNRNVLVKDITFTPTRTTYEPVAFLAKLNSRPAEVSQDPKADAVYGFFEVATNGAVRYNTNTAKVTVEVEQLWLDSAGLDNATVKMWTFNEKTKKWQGVPVTRSQTSTGATIVSHISLENSLFSVTADKKKAEEEEPEQPEEEEPKVVEEPVEPPVVEEPEQPEEEEKKKIKITSVHVILFIAAVLILMLGIMMVSKVL